MGFLMKNTIILLLNNAFFCSIFLQLQLLSTIHFTEHQWNGQLLSRRTSHRFKVEWKILSGNRNGKKLIHKSKSNEMNASRKAPTRTVGTADHSIERFVRHTRRTIRHILIGARQSLAPSIQDNCELTSTSTLLFFASN